MSIPRRSAAFQALFVVLLLAVPGVQAQEAQVPFDDEGQLTVVDADLRERLELFGKVEGFEEARLFRTGADAYELVIRYEDAAGRSLRERRMLSEENVRMLRQRVSRRLAQQRARRPARADLEDGRYRFLAATTTLGLIDAPLFVGALSDDADGIAAAALLGGTTGFFVPLLLTRNAKVTEAEATLTGYGGFQGIAHGVQLTRLLLGDVSEERTALALAALFSAAEATAGFQLARRTDMRGGTAEALSFGGLFGAGLGTGAVVLVTGGREERVVVGDGFTYVEEESSARSLALGSLVGSTLGAYGGYRLARAFDYSQGDTRIAGTAGLLGTLVSNAALFLADRNPGDDERLAAGVNLAGTLGGLALGPGLVRDREFSEAQGNIACLGAVSGGLAGGALGIITDANEDVAVTLTTLGAVGGFLGTYFTYRGEAQPGSGRSALNLDVRLAPGSSLEGGTGGPLGDFAPALNVRLGL